MMWLTIPAFLESLIVALLISVPLGMQYGLQFILLAKGGHFMGLYLARITIMALIP